MGSIWLLEGKENKIIKPGLVFWIRLYFGFTFYFGFCLYTAILTQFMIFLVPYSEIQGASVWHIALIQELTQIDWKLIKSIDAHSLGQHINETSTYNSDFWKFTNKSFCYFTFQEKCLENKIFYYWLFEDSGSYVWGL